MTGSTSFLYARRHFDVLPLNCADHVISFSYWPVDSWSRYIPGALLSEGKGLIKELFYIKKCILRKKTRFDLAVHYLASNCATNNVFQRCRQNAGDCSATPPPPPLSLALCFCHSCPVLSWSFNCVQRKRRKHTRKRGWRCNNIIIFN